LSVPTEGDVVFLLKTDSKDVTFDLGEAEVAGAQPATPEFAFNFDPTAANKVHRQTDGILCVEAEDFAAVDREVNRKWHLTTADQTPNVEP
jgi:hypothetical protein